LYDQGGLIFVFPQPDRTKRWIKSGIEFYLDQVFVNTVTADRGADISLVQTGLKGNEVALEARNEKGALWIYVVDGEKKVLVREITWALSDGDNTVWVGILRRGQLRVKKGMRRHLQWILKG
jgi:regulation of enolase protein 1 (concanavalin A-like superfamily)